MPFVAAPLAGSFLTNIALNLAISFALGAITKKFSSPKTPDAPAFSSESVDRRHILRSPIAPRRGIYGEVLVSGSLVYAETTGASTEFLHLVVAVAGHEVEEIGDVWLGDAKVGSLDATGVVIDGTFAKDGDGWHVRIRKHLGASNQVAETFLVSESSRWTAAHQGRGVAYVYIRLKWTEEQGSNLFPSGVPTPTFVVKGKSDLFDPRDSSTGYSNNAALCVLDYLRGSHGYGATDGEIDMDSFKAAANTCDELVSVPDGNGGTTTQKRYTCNGTYTREQNRGEIMEDLLSSCGGVLVERQGIWHLFVAEAGTAIRAALTEDDLRGPIKVRPKAPRRDLFNAVRGTFADKADRWQLKDFPPMKSATYKAQDGGEEVFRDVEYPYTTDVYIAQRLAKIELERHRRQIIYEAPVKLSALDVTVWDVVPWTIGHLGWVDKDFRVLDWEFSATGGINLLMQEEDPASYSWVPGDATEISSVATTNLPSPAVVSAPSDLQLDSGNAQLFVAADGTVKNKIFATWTPPLDVFVTGFKVQYRRSSSEVWLDGGAPPVSSPYATVTDAEEGVAYDVRVRSINGIGARSGWLRTNGHVVVGKTAPPDDVPWFDMNGTEVRWGEVTNKDLAGYALRSQAGVNFDYGTATPLHDGVLRHCPHELPIQLSGVTTLLIVAVDTSGNVSAEPASVVVNLGDAPVANVVITQDEHGGGFPGTITGATVDGGTGDLVSDPITPLMWPADRDVELMWAPERGGDLMWPVAQYEAVTYEWTVPVAESTPAAKLEVALAVTAPVWVLEYRHSSLDLMWPEDADVDLMWPASRDTEIMWPKTDWKPWPGSVVVSAGADYEFRLTIPNTDSETRVTALSVTIDVPDRNAHLGSVAIAGAGTRLALPGAAWNVVTGVQLTVSDDGGSARLARVLDYDAALGPLVETLTIADAAVAGTVVADIQGY